MGCFCFLSILQKALGDSTWTTSSAPVSSSQGMSPVGSSRKFTMDLRRDQCMLRYIIITQLSSSFLQINEQNISCPSMIELSLEFWCLIYSLKTCSIKSPFVFQYINKKFLFFLPVDNFTSALHYMNCILYQTFQKMNYVSTKN